MSVMLVRVLYVSSVAQGVTGWEIERLVASSRRRNRQLDLTGALVVCARRFAQVLEGRQEAVDAMLERIAHDERHADMRLVSRDGVVKRLCDGWDMAFVDDEGWAAILDRLSAGAISPDEFCSILIEHFERHRSKPF